MMHRCRGSHQGHVMGPCSCGMIHHHGQTNSFSMLFSKSYADSDMYSSSSSVDCTLSLATPSTRLSSQQDHDKHNNNLHDHRSVSNFCWDLLQSKHVHNSHQYSHTTKPTRTTTNTNISTANNNNNDPLLARRCANCDTTSTPLWRNGPRGPKSLCNACGIRFKKEERRAGAVAATTAAAASSGGVMETAAQMFSNGNNNGTWYGHSHHHNQGQKMMGNEFRYVNDDGDRREATPFLSWRLNVTYGQNKPCS